ncbi:MAG: cell division protein FtsZ [Candidatus Latescibacterota bacterium]|nr:cell division protein FtsZ [Candidatus Latescibacterota bacterium]
MTFEIIDFDQAASIKVVGVGGAGGNAINRMVASGMHGVEFISVNTDNQDLEMSAADVTLCIGESITRGLGAGAKPEIARQAVEEDRDKVAEHLTDTDLVFITAGMGGGTGTGAAPVVAQIAKEQGALAVGIVTEPFQFEGLPRMRNAQAGIAELQEYVDTLIVIKNQRLLSICARDTTLEEAFSKADDVLLQATRGIADLITINGMINLDFNDVKTVITEGGDAIIGVGSHRGENRALEAAKKAIKSPLIEDISIAGAKGALINISAGSNFTLYEANEAASVIQEAAGNEANIIFGTVIDEAMVDEMRVTVIATGFHLNKKAQFEPAAETTKVVGPRRQVRAALGVQAVTVDVAPEVDADDDLGGDLDYPAILRKQQA